MEEHGGAWRGTIGRGVMEGDDRGRRGEVLTCRGEGERGGAALLVLLISHLSLQPALLIYILS